MMWNRDERDVRAWILKGRPERREADAGALIKMPAFESRSCLYKKSMISSFLLAASYFGPIPDEAALPAMRYHRL
jgi:hypothetical protein